MGHNTYTTKDGVSYSMNNKGHNIQRTGTSWMVDGKESSLEEMEKLGIATKI